MLKSRTAWTCSVDFRKSVPQSRHKAILFLWLHSHPLFSFIRRFSKMWFLDAGKWNLCGSHGTSLHLLTIDEIRNNQKWMIFGQCSILPSKSQKYFTSGTPKVNVWFLNTNRKSLGLVENKILRSRWANAVLLTSDLPPAVAFSLSADRLWETSSSWALRAVLDQLCDPQLVVL